MAFSWSVVAAAVPSTAIGIQVPSIRECKSSTPSSRKSTKPTGEYLSYATEAMDDLKIDIAQNHLQLVHVSQTLATTDTIACGIELFGTFSASLVNDLLAPT
ncbi:hypothetical protein C8F04DRAFT_1201647 [Mycena alexandri]|uniref:Uncharacterized protein n=1 Tax=Mycena alexandri TaxID=1745969 RepID=A0AAD6RY38_9AGAR|nr:hypothetical protein C8F04DRAFT_1201647 [Mycena alexandri]